MPASALAHKQLELDILPGLRTRDEITRRYRHLREISRRINDGLVKHVPASAIIKLARRFGLAERRTLVLESMDQMAFLFDLAIYTAPPERTRPIDRYARTVQFESGSDEARVLEAMVNARFILGTIERRHETAGLIIRDLLREKDVWLVDEGLECSTAGGGALVTRVFTPDEFSVTTGVVMPVDAAILDDAFDDVLPRLRNHTPEEICDDRRFAEAIYRTAMEHGIMDYIGFQEVPPEQS
jgi:hypothetical protein